MALKAKLANLEGLDDGTKSHYKQGSDGTYHLDVEGDDQRDGLRKALDSERGKREAAEKAARELSEKLGELTSTHEEFLRGNVPKSNVEALDSSYKKKLADQEATLKGRIGSLESGIRRVLVSEKAAAMAAALATDPDYIPLIQQQIESRLAVEIGDDGVASARVLKDGKPSALSLEELSQEIAGMPMLRAVVSGSKASGGGSSGSNGSGGTPLTGKIDLSKATDAEKLAYYKRKHPSAE